MRMSKKYLRREIFHHRLTSLIDMFKYFFITAKESSVAIDTEQWSVCVWPVMGKSAANGKMTILFYHHCLKLV